MNDNYRQTRIIINTSEWTLIKKVLRTVEADCPQCGAPVEMATPEQAVTLYGIPSRHIYGWVESGQVHFIETTEGHLLICLRSLRARKLTQTDRSAAMALHPTGEVNE